MKLSTDILPRKDGTVTASIPGDSGANYVFAANANGALECDVADDVHIAWLLDTGYFYPADEADIDAAVAVSDADIRAAKKRGRKPKGQ